MRKRFQTIVQTAFRSELLKTRHELSFTQEEMAHLLFMSTRSYASIEAGCSCCGLITFLIFLTHYCFDPIDFLIRLTVELDKALEPHPESIVTRSWINLRCPEPVSKSAPHGNGDIYLLCPHCGAPVARDFQPFCGQCSQSLDWSKVFPEEEALPR